MSLAEIYIERCLLPEAAEQLRETGDEELVLAYLRQQIRDRFPDYEGTEALYLQQVRQACGDGIDPVKAAPGEPPVPARRTRTAPKPPPAALPRQAKLNFRLIDDDRLDLADRIILSFTWKWAWINFRRTKQGVPLKAVNAYRVRRATRLRHSTIVASLARLRGLGYLDAKLEPFVKHERLLKGGDGKALYRKLTWERGSAGIRLCVFRAVVETNKKKCTAGWFRKALGISRRTYYRYRAAVTGGTADGTGDTP
jgi:hypothetical protein